MGILCPTSEYPYIESLMYQIQDLLIYDHIGATLFELMYLLYPTILELIN